MRVLTGHTKDVRTVAYTPAGKLVSGGGDRTVCVWEAGTWNLVRTIKAKGPVYAVAVASDGVVAYAGRAPAKAETNIVSVFDPATGKDIARYELLTLGTVWERDPATLIPAPSVRPVPRSVWSLSFSADGRFLAAAIRQPGGGNIPVGAGGHWWDRSRPASHGPLADDRAYSLKFGPSGSVLAVAGEKKVGFYPTPDAATPTTSHPMTAAWAEAVAFVSDGDEAVVAAGGHLYFVDPAGSSKPRRVKTRFRAVTAVAPSLDGRVVLVGGKPGAVEVFDAATGSSRVAYDFALGTVYGIAIAPDGTTFAVAGEKGLGVFDADGW